MLQRLKTLAGSILDRVLGADPHCEDCAKLVHRCLCGRYKVDADGRLQEREPDERL
jgi:hypothetical protein